MTRKIFEGRKVLITGGAGSVGQAVAGRLLKHGVKTVRVLDISENEMFKMMKKFSGEKRIRYLIGDIRDRNRLQFAMDGIDLVIHLAAMKHVYACEYNSFEAIKTNVDGLQNIIDTSRQAGVRKVIFSSTDKAVNPLSVLGITKLLGEKIMASANYNKGDRNIIYASVRFGNVVGSSGSVVPLFKKQIASGGPVTITDNGMTRFVIEMDEAVDLIIAALDNAKGGETFVWKMRTLTVPDLADAMIARYAGKKSVRKSIVGKGDGEKLYEEILTDDELQYTYEFDKFYAVMPAMDYTHVGCKYRNAKRPRNPIMNSEHGKHMTRKQIIQLMEKLDNEKSTAA